jgi:hypothetical protein
MTLSRVLGLIVIVSLAMTLAEGGSAAAKSAASKTKRTKPHAPVANTASSCRGGNLFPCGPVYNGDDYLGNDPDPFIRAMIQRDLGAKYGGEN